MKVRQKDFIWQAVMNDLLSAHKRVSANGSPKGIIRLSKYILKLSKQGGDKLVELGLEENEARANDPPSKSHQYVD